MLWCSTYPFLHTCSTQCQEDSVKMVNPHISSRFHPTTPISNITPDVSQKRRIQSIYRFISAASAYPKRDRRRKSCPGVGETPKSIESIGETLEGHWVWLTLSCLRGMLSLWGSLEPYSTSAYRLEELDTHPRAIELFLTASCGRNMPSNLSR